MIATLEVTGHSCGAPYLSSPDYLMEEPGARAQVDRWYPVMVAIDRAPRVVAAIEAASRATGEKLGNVKKLYYEHWRGSGRDWRMLIDRRKFPDPREALLPPLFEQFIRSVHDGLNRDQAGEETYRLIMARFAAWEANPMSSEHAIPGYDTPPRRDPFLGHPAGWSKRSILRRLPNKHQRALRKRGPKAASEFLPSLYTTREGLSIGQIIYFDDQWHDTRVNFSGVNTKAMRPQSFNSLDALTAYAPQPGLKPQVWDEEKSKRVELNQEDFFWYVMTVLTQFGYNAETGTTLIFEHGTANVDKRDALTKEGLPFLAHFDWRIKEYTHGKVVVNRSGIWHEPAFKGMLFEGKPTGNFRFKAPIESSFNLVRNRTQGLPAPTGRNPECDPEESYGLVAYNDKLLKMVDTIPAEQYLRLKRPVMEWEDYSMVYRGIHHLINQRLGHRLQGWRKLGFTGQEYRLSLASEDWMSEEAYQLIPAEHRAALDHIVRQEGYFRSFLLSPEQAYLRLKDQLTKLPMSAIPVLAPERLWKPIRVSDQLEMTMQDHSIDSEPLRFLATKVRTPQGYEVTLERGKTYLRLLNIFAPDQMWIADKDGPREGAIIGIAPRILPPSKGDAEGIQRAMGEQAYIRSIQSKEAVVRMEGPAAKRIAMREHNKNVLNGTTAEDRAEQARLAEHAVPVQDFLNDAPAEAESAPALKPEDFL